MKIEKEISRVKLTIFAIAIQKIVTIACGFVLPWLFIHAYGSEVNGLISSISQLISVIALLELGLGTVVPAALYKPLALEEREQISKIYKSAQCFFNKIGIVLIFYVGVLVAISPYILNTEFSFGYVSALIVIMSINAFSQYYFGIVSTLLLIADQRAYVPLLLQSLTTFLISVSCYFLIKCSLSIHLVQLFSALIFLIKPVSQYFYVKKCYSIDMNVLVDSNTIPQKWSGVTQHIAGFVLNTSPTLVLTFCSSLQIVSVFSVYNMVGFGVKGLVLAFNSSIASSLGKAWARNDVIKFNKIFEYIHWVINSLTTTLFCAAIIIIGPFISIFTKSVTDVNYWLEDFALYFLFGCSLQCFRQPYDLLIMATGKFRETQMCYLVAAIINLFVSVLLTKLIGINGVAFGLIAAMVYQIVYLIIFDSKNIIKIDYLMITKQFCVNGTVLILSLVMMYMLQRSVCVDTFETLIIYVILVISVVFAIEFFVNTLFYNGNIKQSIKNIRG